MEPDPDLHELHPVFYEKLDGALIRRIALRMDGAGGPSGLDGLGWKRLCTAFGIHSADLCNSLASIAKRLCTEYVDPKGIEAFVPSKLIALDKSPGVRPIGVGETVRRIINKAISSVIKDDVQEVIGALQLCAGQESGCEAAIHAMREVFNSTDTEAIILVDASNAFNSLNREVALRNVKHLCPSLATILINTYRSPSELFIKGETILSQEGTTQGNPLAMAMYAISTIPLIHCLSKDSLVQAWYADDASAGGKLADIQKWWDHLTEIGPNYGYLPNTAKTCLIVKEEYQAQAMTQFEGTGITITQEGKRHLGAALGTESFVKKYVDSKVTSWVEEIDSLCQIAQSQPHAAFTHGVMNKWNFVLRTIPNIQNSLQPLEDIIPSYHHWPKSLQSTAP